jgi:hypothetical protein
MLGHAPWPGFKGFVLPFLTLDAEYADHSGAVLIVCADPRVVAGANPPQPSRVQQLVTRVRNNPPQGRHYGLSPHVIAVTCPPRIVGEDAQLGRFVDMNAPVLAGASHIVVEAHNGCAGLGHFYQASLERLTRQGSQTPYFDLQRQLLERGIERFARRVAALSKQSLVVEANYVDFGSDGSVVGVTSIRTVRLNGTGQGREPELELDGFQATSLYGGLQAMSDYDGFQAMPGYGDSRSTRRRRWPGTAGNRRSR